MIEKLGITKDNHTSAIDNSSHIKAYSYFPLHDQKKKLSSDRKKVFTDLSWPMGEAVNNGAYNYSYLGTEFQLHYPSVDDIFHKLNTLGPAAKIFKVDISRAFFLIRTDPGDIDLLGLQYNSSYYINLSLPFRFRLWPFFFQKLSNGICYIMNKNGHNAFLNYIDDLIYCGLPSSIHLACECLLSLLADLGLDISVKNIATSRY